MYTNKANVLELLSLLKKRISSVVLCPGSRNIPLVQSMANDPDFTCYSITDERSAGFFAIGLALQSHKPVAVCCTSGSALLNLHPAVSEAFYQQVPLLVISADRPVAWLGQMDGQTVPQAHVFGSLVKYSADLPEIKDNIDGWLCNRLINEALLALEYQVLGPVHINVPISEPFFSFDVPQLPKAREIQRFDNSNFSTLLLALQSDLHLPSSTLSALASAYMPEHAVNTASETSSADEPSLGSSLSNVAQPNVLEANQPQNVDAPDTAVTPSSSLAADAANRGLTDTTYSTANPAGSYADSTSAPSYSNQEHAVVNSKASGEILPENETAALLQHLPLLSSLVVACRIILCHYPKLMLIIGQNSYAPHCMQKLTRDERKMLAKHVLIVDESLSNLDISNTCRNIDRTLSLPQVQANTELEPQLLITLGGHIISKRLKHYLREHQPAMHWHIAPDGAVVDLYHCLTHVIACQPQDFMYALYQALCLNEQVKTQGLYPLTFSAVKANQAYSSYSVSSNQSDQFAHTLSAHSATVQPSSMSTANAALSIGVSNPAELAYEAEEPRLSSFDKLCDKINTTQTLQAAHTGQDNTQYTNSDEHLVATFDKTQAINSDKTRAVNSDKTQNTNSANLKDIQITNSDNPLLGNLADQQTAKPSVTSWSEDNPALSNTRVPHIKAKAQSINVALPPKTKLIARNFKNLSFASKWMFYSQQVFNPSFAYSQMQAIGQTVENLPKNCTLHLANSSTVRYAQLFNMPVYPEAEAIKVMSNRGVNGIEGSLSTAIGYAAADPSCLNFILIGDLSFFYDVNALWNSHVSPNVRIMLLNNGGGEIFHALPNLKLTTEGRRFVTAEHSTSAAGWAKSQGFKYMSAHNQEELNQALSIFLEPITPPENPILSAVYSPVSQASSKQVSKQESPLLLEVFTDQEQDTQMLKAYMHQLQTLN